MQKNILIRHQIIQSTRTALTKMGFLEIETPLLVRSTPEGARDFVVPSRLIPGKFYALPQSPQLYKQLLMVSGMDRYFQFAPAFRDEDLRSDRVPVHTQIDMEMSFVEEQDVFLAVETYMTQIFKDVLNYEIVHPFPIMPYANAIELYGLDKPDTRFELLLQNWTKELSNSKNCSMPAFLDQESTKNFAIRALVVPNAQGISRKLIETEYADMAKTHGASILYWTRFQDNQLQGGIAKHILNTQLAKEWNLRENDLLLFAAGPYEKVSKAMGQVRNLLGKNLNLYKKDSPFHFLWVNEFPLFEWDPDRNAFNAMHHLFTSPLKEDEKFLDTDPERVRGQLYDLVLNGQELCSGSIRINRPEMQEKILDIVQMPKEEAQSKFGFLMDAFKYGAPPHGGSAVGLDRLTAILCQTSSIRDCIAFPCNNQGIFPLDGSPAEIDQKQLNELHLELKKSDSQNK